MPKRKETVELEINGQVYKAWENVQATAEFGAFRQFAFLATEAISGSGGNYTPNWATLQIAPGDKCKIKFAGEDFLNGKVTCRTANYNAVMHNVLISGKSKCGVITDASASMKDNGGGQFQGQKWKAIADKVLSNFKDITLEMQGDSELANKPFRDAQINPGETVFNFLGRLARSRGITLYDNHEGQLVAYVDSSAESDANEDPDAGETLSGQFGNIYGTQGPTSGDLVEGKNIQAATGRIEDTTIFPHQSNLGQDSGTDAAHGRKVCQAAAYAKIPSITDYKPNVHIADRPQQNEDCVARNDYEGLWTFNDNIAVDITVYGWQSNSGGLWQVANAVRVESPMLMLSGRLFIQRVTFTQDNAAGSLAKLHLVNRLVTKQINLGLPGASNPEPSKPGTG
jgi:prophage tail gpP-like protein